MSFQPVVPLGGYGGWRFLQRTLPQQMEAFVRAPALDRLADHVRARIGEIRTAAELVADRRLLEVALGAYGLGADLNARAFIQRVLEGGTLRPEALANRLADKRYAEFAREFGFGNLGSRTNLPGFADRLLARFEAQRFQEAVGQANPDLRLALNLGPALGDIVAGSQNPRAQWFEIMGTPPLRRVFETALGLPASFGRLDIDRQLQTFQERARAAWGTDRPAELAAPPRRDEVVRLFLLRAEAAQAPQAPILRLFR
jgi:hypothetical protein